MVLYPYVLTLHICAAVLSGLYYFVRSVAMFRGAHWPRQRAFRMASYLIDSLLLAAAITLVFILPKEVFSNQWLTTKIFQVVLYIGLGIATMREKLPFKVRIATFVASVLVYLNIIGTALTHHPLGWISVWF
ncbi:SirB2 family protein [Asticcacaulis sp. BYS171W]|uniref:SirB2 family protein n=1 Tax=Asticcacaulis aquaticus TaxID=2984212 RepID=A0ABT5HYD4_9CAUL|nr:SirB2 family protein [Asticcacaulis aquaticus]MDC7684456.1 SirB2 family protein [Asticcacaulis aquaticus]